MLSKLCGQCVEVAAVFIPFHIKGLGIGIVCGVGFWIGGALRRSHPRRPELCL